MNDTRFSIPKMDCAAEEQLVRRALDSVPGIDRLSFDLVGRSLIVRHAGTPSVLLSALEPLRFGAAVVSSAPATAEAGAEKGEPDQVEGRTLRVLLGINAAMFVLEFGVGLFARSVGLIADSLDMFADAAVYGIALYAVGRAAADKRRAARLSGYLQILLGVGAVAEVFRRFVLGSDPEGGWMIGMAAVALIANVTCLLLISKHREGGVHMRASWIFSANDVLANAGVIVAGVLVAWTGSALPDLLIAAIVAAVVVSGGVRILRL